MKPIKKVPTLENFEAYRTISATQSRRLAADTKSFLDRRTLVVSWTCRAIAAAIMLETLFFKFTGAPESIYIFSKMNMEPGWRYGQGLLYRSSAH